MTILNSFNEYFKNAEKMHHTLLKENHIQQMKV